jgi:hypothetical protein
VSTAKNINSLHVHDIILIGFIFPQGIQIHNQNRHASPGAQPAKTRNMSQIIPERSKRLRLSQGSIICAQNVNIGQGAQTAKNRKFLHVARKSVIGPRIMQGPSLYTHNCSKLSRDPLKPRLLKNSNTCCV